MNKQISDPTLQDLLDLHTKEIMITMNCHAVATVQSFDSVNQTCKATVNYQKTFIRAGGEFYVDYPILVDCPVICLSGGVAGITFPIKKGDQCVVLFNDRDIDNWFNGKNSGSLNSSRLHSFSDGFVLVGVRSKINPISNYSSTKAVFYHGSNKVSVGPSDIIVEVGTAKVTVGTKIKVEVAGQTLGTLIGQLCDAITLNVPLSTAPGNPINNAAQIAAINLVKTALLGVLE